MRPAASVVSPLIPIFIRIVDRIALFFRQGLAEGLRRGHPVHQVRTGPLGYKKGKFIRYSREAYHTTVPAGRE